MTSNNNKKEYVYFKKTFKNKNNNKKTDKSENTTFKKKNRSVIDINQEIRKAQLNMEDNCNIGKIINNIVLS
jgi:hypothetical protein